MYHSQMLDRQQNTNTKMLSQEAVQPVRVQTENQYN